MATMDLMLFQRPDPSHATRTTLTTRGFETWRPPSLRTETKGTTEEMPERDPIETHTGIIESLAMIGEG